MTQTIHDVKRNDETEIVVDVYYHPDNACASIDDPKSRFRYSVFAIMFNTVDLAEYTKYVNFANTDEVVVLSNVIQLFVEAAKQDQNYIWECNSSNGDDYYREFFVTKDEAEASLLRQLC